MKKIIVAMIALCACAATPAAAQQTTGNIQGRITDDSEGRRAGCHRDREERDDRLHAARKSPTPKASIA